MTGPAWTDSVTSPSEVVEESLNPDRILLGFSRLEGMKPICLTTATCNRSAKLPGSTRILFTSMSPTPNVRMRASRCGCSIQAGSTAGKTMVSSMGRMLLLANPGRMELTCSRSEYPKKLALLLSLNKSCVCQLIFKYFNEKISWENYYWYLSF